MAQLHFYVPDDVAEQIKARAQQANMPISRYVAELVKRDVGQGWPEHYFERIAGAAEEGASIRHEPSDPPEERLPLE